MADPGSHATAAVDVLTPPPRGPSRRRDARPARPGALLLLALLLAPACGPGEEEVRPEAEGAAEDAEAGNFRGRIYERNFVFTTLAGDSAFIVPWLLTAQTLPGSVHRRGRGLLLRGGTWDAFYDQRWETPPTRTPWRILPQGNLRLVVGLGDAVEGLVFSEGARQLEVEISGGPLVEWTGARGQVYRVHEGATYLAEQRMPGLVLDMSRVHGAEEAGSQGDWAFVVSGDSLQMVLEAPTAAAPGTAGGYRAWARQERRDFQWPAVTVDWAAVNSFEPARQDVPVSWTLASEGNGVSGVLQVQAGHIQAGEGPGPLLPVDALFLVAGTLRIEGRTYPVRGLFRHTRP